MHKKNRPEKLQKQVVESLIVEKVYTSTFHSKAIKFLDFTLNKQSFNHEYTNFKSYKHHHNDSVLLSFRFVLIVHRNISLLLVFSFFT